MQSQDDYDYVQPPGWEQVKPDAFVGAPFEVWVNNFQSSSDRAEAFIHDPRRFLRGEVMEDFGGVKGEPIEGVGSETRIQTFVTNHHKTLLHMVLYATAIKSTEEDTLSITLYKKEPGGH
jgi:hypothetical protein